MFALRAARPVPCRGAPRSLVVLRAECPTRVPTLSRSYAKKSEASNVSKEPTPEELAKMDHQRIIHEKEQIMKDVATNKTKLGKMLRMEKAGSLRERILETMDKLRATNPEMAKRADAYINRLTQDEIRTQEYPELNKGMTDLEVFKSLKQFLPEGEELDPLLASAEQNLTKRESKASEMLLADRAYDEEAKAQLSKEFPDLFSNIIDPSHISKVDTLPIDHESVVRYRNIVQNDMMENVMNPPSKEELLARHRQQFDGVNLEHYGEEGQRIQAIAHKLEREVPEIDTEAVVDAHLHHQRVFDRSSIGKYIRFTPSEQQKFLSEGFGGNLERNEFASTKEHSVMMREDVHLVIEKLQAARAACFVKGRAPEPTILYGHRGVGKSCIYLLSVYWARRNGWLVFNIKSGSRWTGAGGVITKSTVIPGCWDQPHVAADMLTYFLEAHSDKLKTLKIRTNPDIPKFTGTTLFDLVEYGAGMREHSTLVVYHLRMELARVIEYPVLIAIDDYNIFYNYSNVWRNPESTRFKAEKLRNQDLTLTRIFMDIHKAPRLANGTFLGAMTNSIGLRHFDIEREKNADCIKVQAYSDDEMNRVMAHYLRTNAIYSDTATSTNQVLRQLTNGYGHEVWKWTVGI